MVFICTETAQARTRLSEVASTEDYGLDINEIF